VTGDCCCLRGELLLLLLRVRSVFARTGGGGCLCSSDRVNVVRVRVNGWHLKAIPEEAGARGSCPLSLRFRVEMEPRRRDKVRAHECSVHNVFELRPVFTHAYILGLI